MRFVCSRIGDEVFVLLWWDKCRFFRQWLVLVAMHQMALGLFRLIASIARLLIIAQAGGAFGLIVVVTLGGFIVSRSTHVALLLFDWIHFHLLLVTCLPCHAMPCSWSQSTSCGLPHMWIIFWFTITCSAGGFVQLRVKHCQVLTNVRWVSSLNPGI